MIYLASDHAGFELTQKVTKFLTKQNIPFELVGAKTFDASDSYVSYTKLANKEVLKDDANFGIYSCGTGIGTSIAANRQKGIRAALCHNVEFAELARKHNNANVLVLPGRFMSETTAKKVVLTFLNTAFEEGRHAERIKKLEE